MTSLQREPDFNNLLAVLRREKPARPTLFEFYLNGPLYERLAGPDKSTGGDFRAYTQTCIQGNRHAGYDYAMLHGSNFSFPRGGHAQLASRSLNEGALIRDRASFDRYPWPDPEACNHEWPGVIGGDLPRGMKLIVCGPDGVLENVIGLTGYDTLCALLYDDPVLVGDLFEQVGRRLVRYYELALRHGSVGAVMSNDDWGFKTQPMLSPDQMRRYVLPWHRRLVEVAHAAGRPIMLHACGQLESLMDDIIDVAGYDAKHSFEDTILPVEEAYERYGHRIAILGGIDLDFLVRSDPETIFARSRAMLERSAGRGGYALGSGNSIPEYVPVRNFLAMIRAATGDG